MPARKVVKASVLYNMMLICLLFVFLVSIGQSETVPPFISMC